MTQIIASRISKEKGRFTVTIPIEAVKKIEYMANRYGITKNAFVVQAALEKIEKMEREQEERK